MEDKRPSAGDEHRASGSQRGGKRPYQTPRLIEYGHVSKLTKAIGTAGGDGGQMMMTCL